MGDLTEEQQHILSKVGQITLLKFQIVWESVNEAV